MNVPILEQGCTNQLLWRWNIPEQVDLVSLLQRMCDRGYQDISEHSWLWVLEKPDSHRLVIVPKTRRLQIRISYLITPQKRQTEAWKIALELHESSQSTSS